MTSSSISKQRAFVGYALLNGFDGEIQPKPEYFTDPACRIAIIAGLHIQSADRAVNRFSMGDGIRELSLEKEMQAEFPACGWEEWSNHMDDSMAMAGRKNADGLLEDLREEYWGREEVKTARAVIDGEIDGPKAMARFKQIESERHPTLLPAIVEAASFCAKLPDLPSAVIEGLLDEGGKMVIGGGSKSFKTWTLIDLAISVATGTFFWDFTTHKGRVLFVNFEIQEAFFARRLQEVARAKALKIENIDVWTLRGHSGDAAIVLPRITEEAAKRGYKLIVLDPLYKLLGSRDENASRDMTDLMNEVERLAIETGAAVVFGSHFAKGNASGKESMDRISGSGVFARDPDSIVTMTRHEEDDCFTVEMTLRNHPPQEPFVVRRQHPLMVIDGKLDASKLKQVGGRKEEVSADQVLELLGDGAMSYTEWCRKAEEDLLISKDTFKRRLRALGKRIRKSPMEDGKYVKS